MIYSSITYSSARYDTQTPPKKKDFKVSGLTFDLVTLQNFPEGLKQFLEVLSCTHAAEVPHKHLGGVEGPSPGLLHHQVAPAELASVEFADGALGGALALKVNEGKLPQHAAAHHLAVRLKDGRQLFLGRVQRQVPHKELYRVALVHGAGAKGGEGWREWIRERKKERIRREEDMGEMLHLKSSI